LLRADVAFPSRARTAEEAFVIPAQAGIQFHDARTPRHGWIPACAGMTERKRRQWQAASQYPKN